MERRKYQRYNTEYTALACSVHGLRAVEVKNLSASGAAIRFKELIPIEEGESIKLHLFAGDINLFIPNLYCQIMRLFPHDNYMVAGVQFHSGKPSINMLIEHIIKEQRKQNHNIIL